MPWGDLQFWAVTAAAVVAAVWIVRRRLARRKSGCAGCSLAEAMERRTD